MALQAQSGRVVVLGSRTNAYASERGSGTQTHLYHYPLPADLPISHCQENTLTLDSSEEPSFSGQRQMKKDEEGIWKNRQKTCRKELVPS